MTTSPKKTLVQLKQKQRMLQIMVFSLATIMIWVMFSLFRSQKVTTISAELKELAKPLTPTINIQVIQKLETKRQFRPEELRDFPIYKLVVGKNKGEESMVTIDYQEEVEETKKTNPSPTPSLEVSPMTELETASTGAATNSGIENATTSGQI